MKRMHIHVGVDDLHQAVKFYSVLFGTEPAKLKPDYAKWMLDDPRINFAISTRSGKKGVDHLGIQVEEDHELDSLRARLTNADVSHFDERATVCCYARSDKAWVEDPAGIAWEAFKTMEDAELFDGNEKVDEVACCAPQQQAANAEDATAVSSGCCS